MRLSASLTKLLILFLERSGELVNREEISACLWEEPQYVDVSNGINTAVNRLRTALGDNPSKPVYIETQVGLGYRFIAPVEGVAGPPAVALAAVYEGGRADIGTGPAAAWASPGISTASQSSSGALESNPEQLADVHDPAPEISVEASRTGGALESPGVSPALPAGRLRSRFWISAAVLLTMAMIVAAVGLRHPQARLHSSSPIPDSPPKAMIFSEATFNDADNAVTAEAVSHDGQSIAFSDPAGVSIWTVGSGLERLLSSPHGLRANRITWYEGDASLLVSGEDSVTGEMQVWVVSLAAEAPRLLLHEAANAAASPDGGRLAFTRRQGSELWLSGSHGEQPHRLVADGSSFPFVLWSPSGDRLVCQRRRLPALNTDPLQSPGREYLWDYQSIDASTGRVLATEPHIRFDSAYLLPDGRMYFPTDVPSDTPSNAHISLVHTEAITGRFLSGPEEISALPGDNASSVSASDDGRQVAAVVSRRSNDVYVAEVHFPGPSLAHIHRLIHTAPDNYPHAWTSNGDEALFESDSSANYAIYKQKLDGSAAGLLARSPQDAVLPQVTPDGKWVMFHDLKWTPSKHVDGIFRVPIDGGTLEQVYTSGPIDQFQCSVSSFGRCVLRKPVGNELVYFAFDPLLGEGKELGRTKWTENYLGDWSLSPDGTTVALVASDLNRPAIRLLTLSSGTPMHTVDISVGGQGTLLEAAWAPDAQGFYVEAKAADTGRSLLYVDRVGHPTLLRHAAQVIWGVPSRDGKKLAFVDQTLSRNVWTGKSLK